MEIKPIRIPRNVIETLPPPVVDITPPPVIRGLEPPVINVPNPTIDYPEIDVPTREEFEGMIPPQQTQEGVVEEDTRDLPESQPPVSPETPTNVVERPTIDVVGLEVPLPELAPIVTAGATAVVTTTVALGSTIALTQLKTALDPVFKRMFAEAAKKSKVKIKQQKKVFHYIRTEDGVDIMEYGTKGIKLLATTDNPEQYIRDQVELSSLYEYDNKIMIDDNIQELFSKEGQKRFKRHFCSPKTMVKKLSARWSL